MVSGESVHLVDHGIQFEIGEKKIGLQGSRKLGQGYILRHRARGFGCLRWDSQRVSYWQDLLEVVSHHDLIF